MKSAIKRILELQPLYSATNTAEMQERGKLVRQVLVSEISGLQHKIAPELGKFGQDFFVEASDGIGRKTELPWVRFCSKLMSPTPRDGFYVVVHFSTDGSAFHITVGCSASQFKNGSFRTLNDADLDRRTNWARKIVKEAHGLMTSFTDLADFGARRPLPQSFQRATALCETVKIDQLHNADLVLLLREAAGYLKTIYEAQSTGRDQEPADLDEQLVIDTIRPRKFGRSQGFGLSADDRKLVEMRAMHLVETWLKDRGYKVNDTSANNPFDFEAAKQDEKIKVEVKGTTSDFADSIFMTRNEVELHRKEKGSTALIIVTGISLDKSTQSASGRNIEPFFKWDIDQWGIVPTAFRLQRPGN